MISEMDIDYEYRILSALRRIIRSVDIYSRKLYAEAGLTTPQLLCLHALSRTGHTTTLSDLAKAVNLGVSTVNGIVDRLEAKSFVVRNRSTQDRRKVFLEITALGREISQKAPESLQDKFSASLARLPQDEQLMITQALERVVELMEVKELDASPNLLPNAEVDGNNKKA